MINKLKSQNLKINLNHIKKLKECVKNNFEKIDEGKDILESLPFLKNDIQHRIDNNILIQPGRIVETIIIQSISNYLECIYDKDGIYINKNFKIEQNGGSSKFDLKITDLLNNKSYIFEIKEPIAYGKSCGFIYNESGKPIDFTTKDESYKEYVKELCENGILSNYNILDNIGHNKIYDMDVNDVITNDFDYIISYDNYGKLFIMNIDEYKERFNFRIEVRSCGKNYRKVFLPNTLNLIDNKLYITNDEIIKRKSRGGNKSKKYKVICNKMTFIFDKKFLKEENGKYYIHIEHINQQLGEISIQQIKKSN